MATTVPTTPTFRPPSTRATTAANSFKSPKLLCLSFRHRQKSPKFASTHSLHSSHKLSHRLHQFAPFATHGETTGTEELEEVQESIIQDDFDGAVVVEDSTSEDESAKEPSPAIIAFLQAYKEAVVSNDESKVSEMEAFLISIEEEKVDLESKMATLSEELSYEKERILRISADFDNFRKRTDRERLSLVTNAQGEVVENLLPVLDNFERAKAQIKLETEGEEKISNSYQSIYKQFVEIMGSLGVVPVETLGKPFDPMLHEAIMREDSTEFEDGIILQEFRKGFKLGDRLLRPSMVKVSAGPGPAKSEPVEPEGERETSEEGSGGESAEGQ